MGPDIDMKFHQEVMEIVSYDIPIDDFYINNYSLYNVIDFQSRSTCYALIIKNNALCLNKDPPIDAAVTTHHISLSTQVQKCFDQ